MNVCSPHKRRWKPPLRQVARTLGAGISICQSRFFFPFSFNIRPQRQTKYLFQPSKFSIFPCLAHLPLSAQNENFYIRTVLPEKSHLKLITYRYTCIGSGGLKIGQVSVICLSEEIESLITNAPVSVKIVTYN